MSGSENLTKNQAAVMTALQKAGKALTAYELLDLVRETGIRAPAQVYRALEHLTAVGRVHRLESLNAFVACSHDHPYEEDENAVAFAICDGCGNVNEIPLPDGVGGLTKLVRGDGFKMDRAVMEIRGQCYLCQVQRETEEKLM